MPKRKRTDSAGEAHIGPGKDTSLRVARLEQKIEQGNVLLHRALKTARGFERQKLGRRQKAARSKNEDAQLARLGAEVEALKGLDLSTVAERYLIKQLVKTKRIAQSPVYAQLDSSKHALPKDGPKDGPAANVVARLLKSNPVRDVVPRIMDEIRDIIGVTDGDSEASKQPQYGQSRALPTASTISDTREYGTLRTAEDISIGKSEGLDRLDRQLASSESEPDAVDNKPPSSPSRASYDHSRYLALSPTPSEGGASESPPAISQKISTAPSRQTSTTTFLPSLTVGGYLSGSESEFEDDEADAAVHPTRKNRMGQQARRKLWEKKFGPEAKHLRKQEQKKGNNRDSGWDARKGATAGQEGRGKRDKYHRSQAQTEIVAKTKPSQYLEGGQRGNKQDSDQKPLHPSWEAARKAKEQKTQAAFQGKKVVFD